MNRQFYRLKKILSVRKEYDVASFKLPVPSFHHFAVPGWSHPVSVCYPASQNDAELMDYRQVRVRCIKKCYLIHFLKIHR